MRQEQHIYSVSQLTDEMRRLMEASYPEIWIEGELSSLSTPASGHLYFSLKDENAQLRCAMFKNRAALSRYRPNVGDLVRVRAKISVYTARGDLQCIVQHMEEAGEGLLQRRYEELKQKLAAEGLFKQEHKQTLPTFPKHIGVITSPSGAAVRDVITTLKRRCPGIPVTIYPAVVQGDSAAPSIVSAIGDAVAHQRADVLILCRGGGSLEDLWCFNHEDVANSIFNCPVPIVSAVGHEVDVTISDFIADLRAPTPTAAAELVSPDRQHAQQQINSIAQRLPRCFERFIQGKAQSVDMLAKQIVHPRQVLESQFKALGALNRRMLQELQSQQQVAQIRFQQQSKRLLGQSPRQLVERYSDRLATQNKRFRTAQKVYYTNLERSVRSIGSQLHTVSPLATLERGFSITRTGDGDIVRRSSQVATKDRVQVSLAEGSLDCEVLSKAETHE